MFSEVIKKIQFLQGTRLIWRRPPKVDIAIIDEVGSDELIELIHDVPTHVVDLSGKSTNVWVLVRSLVRGRMDLFGYTVTYLELLRPQIAMTLIDTTPFFYRLKDEFPDLTTIAVQNGWRSFESKRDFEAEQSELSVDHLLCFGEISRDLYSESIRGNFHIIGSFRSNKVPIRIANDSRKVALISTLRSKVRLDEFVPTYADNSKVPYATIFERRLQLAKYVAEFCRDHSLCLLVLGKEFEDEREHSLYSTALSGIDVEWEFRPRTDVLSNYRNLNETRIAVSTSSSLGYEALGRGIRTAFFMLDPQVTGNFGDRFGWPEPLEDSGEIWTNFLDRQKTIEILSRLHGMTDDSWADFRRRFVPKMISSDPGNTLLKSLIRDSLDNR
jgi:surface carbohydrate biosynthesis protein